MAQEKKTGGLSVVRKTSPAQVVNKQVVNITLIYIEKIVLISTTYMIEYSLLSQKLLDYEIQASKVGLQIDPKT